jgi:hypothetical protein
MQQKQTIALTTSSQPILSSGPIIPIPIKSGEVLERGAFAISLWLNITSWVPPTTVDASFNVLSLNNTNATPLTQILNLYIDATCKLAVSSTLLQRNTKYVLFPTYQITSSPLPINEPVNVILNYNGDDDYTQDENEFLRDSKGNIIQVDGKNQTIYNTDTGFTYKNRALDVFINGMLNNTIILKTSLSKDKGNACDNNMCVSFFNDASMNYFTNNNIQLLVGHNDPAGSSGSGPIGTISNVTFIKGGCSTEDAQSINNGGNSSSILDNILSYKLRFSLLEDDKEVKVYDI